jgi:peptide/nickel transport system permease protein
LRFGSLSGKVGAVLFLAFAALAIAAPLLAPYDPLAVNYLAGNKLARLQPPDAQFLLGTTYYGGDVLSQLLIGARVSLVVGLLSAFTIVFVGTNIGLVAGYYGGRVDAVLMRLTDVAFGIPFLPFAVLLVALLRPSIWNIIFAISCLLWRSAARVIRAQVLSLKQRAFIRAALIAGASSWRIIYLHIFPNVLPMALLYVALGVAYAVLAEASLSFLGFGDPNMISWGTMLYDTYLTGSVSRAWWWALPPGLCITLFVISVFLMARDWERVVNPRLAG